MTPIHLLSLAGTGMEKCALNKADAIAIAKHFGLPVTKRADLVTPKHSPRYDKIYHEGMAMMGEQG